MEKTAQKRSILNRLREMSNVSGKAAEKFFNPEFQKVMESLREKDDMIRSIVTGETIGEADPGFDPISLKDLLKSIKSDLNTREYMSAVYHLGRFHKKLYEVINVIDKLEGDVDRVHHEFLFKELGDDKQKYIKEDLNKRFANQNTYFIKEANIMDFFKNVGTKRGRALAAWEKRYPNQVGKLKKETATMLQKSDALFGTILSALKEMATARAIRNVDNYISAANKIKKTYKGYDQLFKEYYIGNVKGFLEKADFMKQDPQTAPGVVDTTQKPEQLGNQPIDMIKSPSGFEVDTTNAPSGLQLDYSKMPPNATPQLSLPVSGDGISNKEMAVFPSTPAIPPAPITSPDLDMKTKMEEVKQHPPSATTVQTKNPINPLTGKPLPIKPPGKQTIAHMQFFNMLQSLSNESPILLASYISKYAKSIESKDPIISRQLLKIVNSIKSS